MNKLGIFQVNQTSMFLIHIRIKGEFWYRENNCLSPPVIVLLAVPRLNLFCGSFLFFCVFVFAILSCLCHATLWLPTGKGLTSWVSCTGCPKRYETFLNLNKRVQPLSLAYLNVLKYKRICEK